MFDELCYWGFFVDFCEMLVLCIVEWVVECDDVVYVLYIFVIGM